MDIVDLIHQDSVKMEVTDHHGKVLLGCEDKPMSITFYGPDSEERRRAYRKHRTALIKADGDAEEELDAECKFLFQITKAVDRLIFRGKDATLNDMKSMYHDVVAIRAQSVYFVEKDINFIKGPKQS